MTGNGSGASDRQPVPSCPRCGSDDIETVDFQFAVNFLCRSCWTCWHRSLGWLTPVNPMSCRGCTHQQECLERSPVASRARRDGEG